ncbi:MAG: hypothetical protein LC754_08965 [Acidobacteria bacterium]|nr:hypothetical protein [Acidobacteriota bacterium]
MRFDPCLKLKVKQPNAKLNRERQRSRLQRLLCARVNMSVGMPEELFLHEFGSQLWHAFGEPAYHVGSSMKGKQWRDVDVRMILDDEEWERADFGNPESCHTNGKWVALCLAFSALGKQMTGLPIDFQIQQMSNANEKFKGCGRSALGIVALRMKDSA